MVKLLEQIPGMENFTRHLSKDMLLKLVSLLLAVVLWYFVGGEDRVNKTVMVPLEIINLPRDLVISNQYKKEMEVSVSGPRSLILEMSERAVSRQVDLSAAEPGSMVIETGNEDIPVPRGVVVERVQPSSIILSLDKLIQKQFPVSARTVGRVAEGYYVKSLSTDPDTITITGPQTILSQFDELFTRAINLSGVKKSGQLQVPLELEPAIVELIGETSVTADFVVDLETETRSMEGVQVQAMIGGLPREVQPSTVRITANIPKMLLQDNKNPRELLSVTAIQDEEEEQLRVKVIPRAGIELPIEILSIIPQTVMLKDDNPPLSLDRINESGPAMIPLKSIPEGQPEFNEAAEPDAIPVLRRGRKQKNKIQ
jgi:YbbR domain-containing protein